MGDVVGHKEWSAEGKIDPAGIDMNDFRAEVNAMVNQNKSGVAPAPTAPVPEGNTMSMTKEQNDALAAIYEQVGRWHPVRQVFQKMYYNVKDGQLWARAGLADIWNEVVWDGYVNQVDILDGKVDPDNVPEGTPVENIARRGSMMSYVLGGYRETVLGRRYAEAAKTDAAAARADAAAARKNTEEILTLLKSKQ